MPSSERAATIRHWIQSARQRLKRAETYDPGEDTTLSREDAQQAVELGAAFRIRSTVHANAAAEHPNPPEPG